MAPKGLTPGWGQREALVAVLVPWGSRYRLDLTPCMNAAIQILRRKSPAVTFLYTTLSTISVKIIKKVIRLIDIWGLQGHDAEIVPSFS